MRLSTHRTLGISLHILWTSAQTTSFGTSQGPFVTITPSTTLYWGACTSPSGDTGFECARLIVPRDHNNQSDTGNFTIAITRVKAQDQTNYLGPLFINPGGPGDPGTDFLFRNAAPLIELLGKSYDLVSWDPRGVGSTLPALSCFPDPDSRVTALSQEEHLFLFQNDSTFDDLGLRQQSTATGCQTYSSEVLPYMGTMANVRDLNLMNHLYGFSEDLTYLAYSYGTILGSAYAATYPKNIKRMAVDGVLDVNRWFFDKEFFLTSYVDSDKVIDEFFHFCFQAGSRGCAFWHESYAAIRQAFITIDRSILNAPIACGPEKQLDWSQFRIYVWNALKNPSQSWTGAGGFDKFLNLIDNNQLNLLTATAANALFDYIAQGNHEITNPDILVDPVSGLKNGGENSEVISAVDNPYNFGDMKNALPFLQSEQVTNTGYLVQSILGTRGILNNYIKTPAERPAKRWANIKTSYPLLFLSNLRDPLTPLQDAISNSAIFPGSVVLQANISGHTTFAAPSTCTDKVLFAYFNSETLPAPNTICQPDALPFNLVPLASPDAAAGTTSAVSISKLKRRIRWGRW